MGLVLAERCRPRCPEPLSSSRRWSWPWLVGAAVARVGRAGARAAVEVEQAPAWTPPRSATRGFPSITGPCMQPVPRSEVLECPPPWRSECPAFPRVPRPRPQRPSAAPRIRSAMAESTAAAPAWGVPETNVRTTSASPTRTARRGRRAFAVAARLSTTPGIPVNRAALASSTRTAAAATARHRPCRRWRNAEERARICSRIIATPRWTRASTIRTASWTEAILSSVSTTLRRGTGRAAHRLRRIAHRDPGVDRQKTDVPLGAPHLDTRARGGRWLRWA